MLKRITLIRVVMSGLLSLASVVPASADGGPGDNGQGKAKPSASADANPWSRGVSPEQRAKALALFEAGAKHFENGRYAQAQESYTAALKQWAHPSLYFNSAQAAIHLQQPQLAWRHLQEAIKYGPEPLDAGKFEQAEDLLASLRGQLNDLTILVPKGTASLLLDGEIVAVDKDGQFRLMVRAGRHEVAATAPLFMPYSHTLQLAPGGEHSLRVEFVPATAIGANVERRWPRWLPWSVLTLGTGAVATGVGFGIASAGNFDDFDRAIAEACPGGCAPEDAPREAIDLRARARAQRTVAVIAAGAGLAVAAGGVVMLLLNQPRESAGFAPTAGDGGVGAMLWAEF